MKRNIGNRILAFLLSIMMIVALMPTTALGTGGDISPQKSSQIQNGLGNEKQATVTVGGMFMVPTSANNQVLQPAVRETVYDFTLANHLYMPLGGCTPATELVGDLKQYTGTVTWKDAQGNTPTTFEINTVYTATVTMTPTAAYTFTGVDVDDFYYWDTTSLTTTLNSDGTITAIATFPATSGLTVTGGTYGTDYIYANNTVEVLKSTTMTISGTTTRDGISVDSGVTANITLNGVDITFGSGYSGALCLSEDATVNLTLAPCTTNKLTGASEESCGIRIPCGDTTLTIGGMGKLIATGGAYAAGIGDNNTFGCGNIIINSGTVIAQGGYRAAGIGESNYVGSITINGGTVTALGGSNSIADIGYGYNTSSSSTMTVIGGSVNAPRISDQPSNGSSNTYLTTITLNGIHEETGISAITAKSADGKAITYGLTGVKTDVTGKLYFYLPEGSVVSSVTAGGNTYTYPSITTNSQGTSVGTIYVPTPAAKPQTAFSFNGTYAHMLTGTTTQMRYSLDGGDTWASCDKDFTSLRGKTVTEDKDIKVKDMGNGISVIESPIQTIDITKADAPNTVTKTDCSVIQNNNGVLSSITSAMEWQKDGDEDWVSGTVADITGLAPGTYYVRVAAMGTALASQPVTLVIASYTAMQEITPHIAADYAAEKLTRFVSSGNYTVNGVAVTPDVNGKLAINAAWFGTTISIIKLGNGITTSSSEKQQLVLAARPTDTNVTGQSPVVIAGCGTITGLDNTMEYRAKGNDSWTPINDTELINLAPGTYYIRIAATKDAPASVPQTVTIDAFVPIVYEVIEGANSTFNNSGDGTHTIRANGDFAKFLNVMMDGNQVPSDKFDAKSGSTIITFNKDYMDSLSNGSHVIVVNFTDGSAETTVTVAAANTGNENYPSTSDNSNLFIWMAILFVSGSMLTVLGLWGKKKKYCCLKH